MRYLQKSRGDYNIWKSPADAGLFLWTNGYVQDERYIAKEHMDVRRDHIRHALRIFEFCLIGNSLVLRQGSRGHVVPLFRTRLCSG